MRYILMRTAFAVLGLSLAGCATIPDVTVPYYFPRSKTQFVVTQTIGCSKADKGKAHRTLGAVMSAVPTTANEADVDYHQGHFQYTAFKGDFDDSDVTVTPMADGRLSQINGTSAGQGGTVISDLVTIAVAAAALGPSSAQDEVDADNACKQVDKFAGVPAAGDSKGVAVITLTYSLTIYYDLAPGVDPKIHADPVSSPAYPTTPSTAIKLLPDAASLPAYRALEAAIPDRMVNTVVIKTKAADLHTLPTPTPTRTDFANKQTLELNKVATVHVEVSGHVGDMRSETAIWGGSIAAPIHDTYGLPIPAANMFGKTAFGITLADNGAITALHYGSTNGAPDAASAGGSIVKALQAQTPEDKANEYKGKADLIAQQQRLVSCQLDATDCK